MKISQMLIVLTIILILYCWYEQLKARKIVNYYLFINLNPSANFGSQHTNVSNVSTGVNRNSLHSGSSNSGINLDLSSSVNRRPSSAGNSSEEETTADREILNFRKSIHVLIQSNRISDALAKVTDYTERNSSPYHDEVLHLSCRWEELSKKIRMSILSNSEILIERNQLVSTLQELTGKLA